MHKYPNGRKLNYKVRKYWEIKWTLKNEKSF